MKLTFLQLLRALLLVALLAIIDHRLFVLNSPSLNYFPSSFLEKIPYLRTVPALHLEGIDSLLSTLVQIGAVFLGLYFAAVSPIFAAYSQSAPEVRSRLVEEMVRNGYISLVAFFTGFGTLLLAESSLYQPPGPISMFVAIALGLIAVLSFVPLGVQTFQYHDPASLGRSIHRQALPWIREAASRRELANSDLLPLFFFHRVQSLLSANLQILHESIRKESNSLGIERLSRQSLYLLNVYSEQKPMIPSKSRWFPQAIKYESWNRVDYSEVELLISSNRPVAPKSVPNLRWFEEYVATSLGLGIKHLAERNDTENVLRLMPVTFDVLESMASRSLMGECRSVQDLILPIVVEIGQSMHNPSPPTKGTPSFCVVQYEALLLTAPLVGLLKYLKLFSIENFEMQLQEIPWSTRGSIYKLDLPRSVVDALDILRPKLRIEIEVEGAIVTPTWYWQQIAASVFVDFLVNSIKDQVVFSARHLQASVDLYVAAKRFVDAASVVDRGRDTVLKCRLAVQMIAELTAALEKRFRRVREEWWPESDLAPISKRIEDLSKILNLKLAECIVPLALQARARTEDIPDYFGISRTTLANACEQSVGEGDVELFASLMPQLTLSALLAYPGLMEEMESAPIESRFIQATEPIAAVVNLSGLALIQAELTDRAFRNATEDAWEFAMSNIKDAEFSWGIVRLAISRREAWLGDDNLTLIRTQWQMNLERRLRDTGILVEDQYGGGPYGEERIAPHTSPLICALVEGGLTLSVSPAGVFLVSFLSSRVKDPEAGWTSRIREFAKTITRYSTNTTESWGAGDSSE